MEMTPLRKSAKTRIPSEPWKSFAKALSFPTFPHSHIPDGDRYLRTEFSEIFLQNLTHTTLIRLDYIVTFYLGSCCIV